MTVEFISAINVNAGNEINGGGDAARSGGYDNFNDTADYGGT
jgi:hypothetical protein